MMLRSKAQGILAKRRRVFSPGNVFAKARGSTVFVRFLGIPPRETGNMEKPPEPAPV